MPPAAPRHRRRPARNDLRPTRPPRPSSGGAGRLRHAECLTGGPPAREPGSRGARRRAALRGLHPQSTDNPEPGRSAARRAVERAPVEGDGAGPTSPGRRPTSLHAPALPCPGRRRGHAGWSRPRRRRHHGHPARPLDAARRRHPSSGRGVRGGGGRPAGRHGLPRPRWPHERARRVLLRGDWCPRGRRRHGAHGCGSCLVRRARMLRVDALALPGDRTTKQRLEAAGFSARLLTLSRRLD